VGIVSRSQGGSGTAAVVASRVSRAVSVGGDITTNNPATMAELAAATGGPGTGGLDLTIAAVAGDVLLVSGNLLVPNTTAVSLSFDIATWVTGAAVTWLGQTAGGASNIGLGVVPTGVLGSVPIALQYVAQAGDLTGGNVVLRLHYRSGAATNRVVSRSVLGGPLTLGVANFKQ
jgi:hypothetical protein